MKIGSLEISVGQGYPPRATLMKHYNDHVSAEIDLTEDDIHSLDFAVKEIKRKLKIV